MVRARTTFTHAPTRVYGTVHYRVLPAHAAGCRTETHLDARYFAGVRAAVSRFARALAAHARLRARAAATRSVLPLHDIPHVLFIGCCYRFTLLPRRGALRT